MFFDVLRGKKTLGSSFCVGAVVGLVAITPAAGYVAIPQSIFIGVVAAIISNMAVHLKRQKRYSTIPSTFSPATVSGAWSVC